MNGSHHEPSVSRKSMKLAGLVHQRGHLAVKQRSNRCGWLTVGAIKPFANA